MDLRNKLVVITGASSGLGRELALQCANQGAKIVAIARSEKKLRELCQEISDNGGQARYFICDLSILEQVKATIAGIESELGTPDILINNAGAGKWRFVEETDYEEFLDWTAVPYLAAVWMTRGFIKQMTTKQSFIVNVTSAVDLARFAGATAYMVARSSMRTFSDGLRWEMRGTQVRVMLYSAGKITNTGYFESNESSEQRIPGLAKILPQVTAEKAAAQIIRGIRKNKTYVTSSLILRIFYYLHRLFPRIVNYLIYVTGPQRKDMVY